MRKTKILCTLGPASSSLEKIGELLDAGMNAARINFSHGDHEHARARIETLRKAARTRDRMVPVVADLQGPKIRTGKLQGGGPVELKEGQLLRLTPQPAPGDQEAVSIDYPSLAQDVQKGDPILLDDGAIRLWVERLEGADVICEVGNNGSLEERKGVNVPGATLKLRSITDKDKKDLEFALAQGVDYVALSFVRSAADIRELKQLIEAAGADTPVIAKLEKPQALEHLEEIIQAADAVMVARGDLGVELSPWKVPVAQKRIIDEAARLRKPVITATQMLESMIHSPTPTRAEASDVANAVFDGTDAVMLSGETAVGEYPVESVRMMAKIIDTAEEQGPPHRPWTGMPELSDLSDAVAFGASHLAETLGAKYIVVYTESGYSARLVSKHRPNLSILGLSRHRPICQRMKLLWGVRAKRIEQAEHIDELVEKVDSLLQSLGWVKPGELVCVVAGTPFQVKGKTDLIKFHQIGEASS